MLLSEIAPNPHVTFEYEEDSEGNKNRGWQVDKITALLDGKPVGYIKLSYIPRARFDNTYYHIFNYLANMKGMTILPPEYKNAASYERIPVDILKKYITYAAMAIHGYVSHNEQTRLSQLPDDEVLPEYRKLEQVAKKKYGKEFEQFEQYHVDKPLVDYINVDDNYKRKGIGTALYRAAYEWMKSRGMRVYASGIQSPEAIAAWKKLEQDYPIGREEVIQNKQKVTRRFFAG